MPCAVPTVEDIEETNAITPPSKSARVSRHSVEAEDARDDPEGASPRYSILSVELTSPAQRRRDTADAMTSPQPASQRSLRAFGSLPQPAALARMLSPARGAATKSQGVTLKA